MAKLANFVTDTKAMHDGMWVLVDPARYEDLEILSCGFTDEMIDARAELEAAAAERLGLDRDRPRLPNAEQRQINAQLLERYLVKDVRHLLDDDDKPITVEEFHRLMYLPGYEVLATAAWQAARRISVTTARRMETALGNSLKVSKSSSNGEAHGSASRA